MKHAMRMILMGLVTALGLAVSPGFSVPYNVNLLANPGGESSSNPWVGWTQIANGGDGLVAAAWGNQHSGSNLFATSSGWMQRCQTNNLLSLGFTAAALDSAPAITVGEWFQTSPSYGGQFYLKVELRDASLNVIAGWTNGTVASPVVWGVNSNWTLIAHTFTNYGAGVRYVRFEDGGKDTLNWAGNYGIMLDDAYVNVGATCALMPSSNGPAAGGNTLIITNFYPGSFGSGSDITNVVFSNTNQTVSATGANILGQGSNWVRVVVPAHSNGSVSLVIQSSGASGNTTLSSPQYTFNPAGSIGGMQWMDYRITFKDTGPLYPTNTAQDGAVRWTQNMRTNTSSVELISTGAVLNAVYLKGNGDFGNLYTGAWQSNYTWIAIEAANTFMYQLGPYTNCTVITNLQGSSYQVDMVDAYPGSVYNCYIKVFPGAFTNGASTAGGSYGLNASVWQNPGGGGNNVDCQQAQNNHDRYITWTNVVPSNGVISLVQWCISGQYNFLNCMRIRGLEPVTGGAGAGVTPSSGSYTGGYPVTISGSNLCNGILGDVTNVTLCGITGVVASVAGSTQIVVTAGAAPNVSVLGDVRVYSISYGLSVKTNGFTYTGAGIMAVRGTNGAVIASGEAASTTNGTDFGFLTPGLVRTNTFSITNSGSVALNISGVTTNGAGASSFSVSNMPSSVAAGSASNFTVRFALTNATTFAAAVYIVNDSTTTPYIINLAGTGGKLSQTISGFAPQNGTVFTNVSMIARLSATASSGLAVTFATNGGPGLIAGGTNLSFSSTGVVYVVASQTGNVSYAAAPPVTNTYYCLGAPYWTSTPVTNATDGELYTYTLTAAGPSGAPISFSGASLPPWLTMTSAGFVSGDGIISTMAGNGSYGSTGDGGPATNASFSNIYRVGADAAGNVYVPDSFNNRVRKITAAGIITTIAGTGVAGWSGDGGAATNAKLNMPESACVDALGVVYITDYNNNLIRRVGTNGIITTVAGTGSYGYSGDGGPATNAKLGCPCETAVDAAGNLFVVDYGNSRIRRIGTNGIIQTIAGTGAASYNGDGIAATNATLNFPQSVVVDTAGNVLVGDSGNNRIRRIGTNGIIRTIAGTGTSGYNGDEIAATNAQLNNPNGMTFDADGNLFMADYGNNRVRRIGTNGIISTCAGSGINGFSGDGGSATNAKMSAFGVAVDSAGRLLIADLYHNRIRRVALSVSAWTLSGTPGPGYVGATNVTLWATSSSGSTPQIFTLTIAGRARPLILSGALVVSNGVAASPVSGTDFGTVGSNTIESLTLSITNSGTAAMTVSGISTSGANAAFFSIANLPASLAVGASSNFDISYRPMGEGPHAASFSINNNGTNTPYIINVAGSGIRSGQIGLNRGSMSYSATYRGINPPVQTFVITNKGPGAFSYSNTDSAAWFTLAPVTGYLAAGTARIHTGTVSIAGSNAGTYSATNTITSELATNSPVNMLIQLTINQATQAITFAAIADQKITNTVGLRATASSSNAVSFYVMLGSPGVISGTNLTFTGEGTVWVVASQAGDVNYTAAPSVTNSINVTRVAATVTLTNLNHTYDGNVHTASVTTIPTNLNVVVNYSSGSTAPSNAGSYAVTALINETFYTGTATGTLVIARANQTINFPAIPNQSMSNAVGLYATATSSNAVTFTVASGMGIINGTNLTFAGAGQVKITADQAGDNNWNAAPTVTNSLSVSTIPVWTSANVTNATDGARYTYTLTATDPGGMAVTFNASNLPPWLTLSQSGGSSIISTIAGKGTSAYSGDNGPATNAGLAQVYDVAADAAGNIYMADYNACRIRKISTNGIITTVAGNGVAGNSGDGGQATNAAVYCPANVSVNTQGVIYITDAASRIRRVGTNGIITLFAGTGISSFSGDGGAATNARMNYPCGTAVDAVGKLYIADYYNNRVRRVGTDGIIQTIAGTGTSGFSGDGGPATSATFNAPLDVKVDAVGNVYVLDFGNNRVRKINTTSGVISTIAGTGTAGYNGDGISATNAKLNGARALALDTAGNVYVADYGNYRIRRIGTNGLISTIAGSGANGFSGDGGAATNASMTRPIGVVVDSSGNVVISDQSNYRIRRVSASGAMTWTLSGTPGPGDVGVTNVTLYANNGTLSTSNSFNITVAGTARPLLLNRNSGATIANGAYSSPTLGTDFGTVGTNEVLLLSLSITNFGTAPLTISGVSTSGYNFSSFTFSNLPAVVAAGTASNFALVYAPGAIGTAWATLSLTNNGTNSPYVIKVAGYATRPGAIGLSRASFNYSSTYGGANPVAQTYVITNKVVGGAGFSYSNASGAAWFSVNAVTGYLASASLPPTFTGVGVLAADSASQTHTGMVNCVGMNAGSYTTTNTLSSPTASNSPVNMLVNLTIAQANQTITFPSVSDQWMTNTVGLNATAASGLPVSFNVASGPGSISGTNLTFSGDGTVWVVASQTGNLNYAAALAVTNPVNVSKSVATVTLSNLSYTYDCNVHTATVATIPAALNVVVSYGGGTTPSNAGSYSVSAQVSATNYTGTATGTLVIARASQVITNFLPASSSQDITNTFGLSAQASSGLTVTNFVVVSGMATVTGGANLTFTAAGSVLVAATQAGDDNYNAAPNVTNTYTVASTPCWSSTPVTNATEGLIYTYTLTGIDPGGLAVTFRTNSVPPWLTLTNTPVNSIISTFAGNGIYGTPVNGGQATNSSIKFPFGQTYDRNGDVYMADLDNSIIYKITTSGVISKFAGTGVAGYSGDGGAATSAGINGPSGVKADAAGNIYISEYYGNRIRKVNTNGIISTIAGTGTSGFSGDGGAATSAKLNQPIAITVDVAGNVFVAEWPGYRIRMINPSGIISTFAGTGTQGFSGDGGAATNAKISNPGGLDTDSSGNLYLADTGNNVLRRIGIDGIIRRVAGTGTGGYNGDGIAATNAQLNAPRGVAVNAAGELFVVDRANFRVRKVGINGLISTFAGTGVDGFSGDGGQAANAKCAGMMGVAVDANGTVLVGDIGSRRVRQITAGGAGTWKLTGTPLPAHVGVTNVSLALFNGTVAVTQSYTLVVSGMARPLVLRGALAVSNNVAASATFGTDFGTVGSNTVQTLTLSITNSGSGPMTISGVSTSGLQPEVFSLQSLPSAVAAGTASNFSIAYSPMSYGAHTASFSITNNGTNTPYVINVAGTGVKPGEIGLNRASFNFSATYGGVNPATQAYVITNKGGVGFAYSNIFDAAWFNVNAPTGYLAAGAIKAHTGTVSVAGLNAGVYVTTNTVSSATASNSPVDMLVQLTLAQAGQTITFPAIGDQKITNSAGLRATATSSQTVTFAVASGPGSIDGTNLTFNNDGTVWVVASQTGDVNYFAAASVTQAVNVAKATATVTVTSTNFTYDGNLKQALYQTSPTGLTCLLTYNGFSAPSGAGTYAVNAQVSDATYGGTGTGTLTIAKASQTITSFIVTTNQLVAATVELSAQASSGLGVTNFVVVSGPGAITGGINLSFTAVGTVLVAATQAGDNNWNAAPNVTNTLIVASDPVWTSIPVTTATDGNLYTYTLGATDPGGLPITFSNLTLPPWLTLGQAGGSPIISTIAGNGISGYSGDNGPATNAIFSNLYGIAADADGNVYVPDYFNNRIRKISTAGIITTIAGTGTSGWSGDGGAATNAKISNPIKLCVSASGVVYFTDYGNNRIRRIGTNGIITTVAGNGSSGYSGDGGQATSATLSTPYGVAVDAAGNLYIADFSNYRIRRVGTDGIIRTFAGTGSVSYNGDGIAATSATLRPIDVAVDAYGNVLVSDYANNRIRKINASGTISTIGGNGVAGYSGDGGVATNAQIKNPYGVTIDTSGNLYLADYGNYRVRRIDTNGMISTYAGNGSNGYSGDGGAATNAVVSVSSVAVDGAGTLVISGFDYRIRRVSSAASSWKLSGTPLIPPATVGQTNVTLYADNGSRSTPQSFTITIAGRARPLLLGEDGVALQNNAPASTAGGTDFGTVPTNANASVTLTITNFGSAELQLTGFTKSGAGAAYFLMSELPSPIAVGGVGEITISYLPSALGLQIASFSIINNGTNTPYVINVAGSGVKPGEMRLQGTFLDYIATYGGTNPAVKTFALQNVGAVAYNYTNTISYGAGGSGWLAVTPNTGAIGPVASPTFAPLIYVAAGNMTGTVNIAGLNAGEYWATNTVSSTNAINSPMNVLARITIGKATQSITNFQAIAAGQTVTSTVVLVAQASSSLAVTFAVASGPGSITNGTGLSFTGNGSVYVVASQTGGVNYLAAPGVTQRVDVIKMTAALVLTNLSYTYDGNAKQATCQTSPTGLTCIVTYDLGAAPSNAGSYAVEATISDANYQGIATGTLVIAKATQTVTFPPIGIQNMTNLVALGATASSGLTASYAIVSGPGVLSGSTLSFNGAGTVLVAAAQAGNGNWNAAAAQTNSVQVYSVPVWTSTPITNAVEGMLYTCTPAATDPANLPVTISGTVLPGWLTLTNVAGSGSGFGISTFAGNGTWGYSGDGGQATDAKLAGPAGVVMDSAGNQYISEVGNQLIRKVRADGVIEVFAGNGTRGSSGDGGQAADAQLADPYGLALDTAGNLYVADYNNNRIRRIGTDGIITTVAGTGTSGFSGDGGQATSAQLYGPVGVTVDSSGAIYVADYNNCRIRKIGADGIIRTIAGTVTAGYNGDGIAATNAQLNHPFRMAVDAQGVVYVADYANNRVRRIGTDGIIQTVAGTGTAGFSGDGGAATNAQLSCPIAVSLDSGGALYVADIGNNRIRRVGTNGLIEAVAGTSGSGSTGDGGPATNATFQNIFDVAVAGNSIYVADYAGCKVRKLAPQSAIWSLAGTPLPVNIGPNPVTLTAGNGISNAVQSFNIVVAGLARPLVKNQDGAVISNGVTADYMLGTDFGTVATNEDLTVTLSITNSGTAALQISGVTITGGAAGYFTVSNMPATVGVGAVSNFSILYAPAALGPHSAAIALANNGTNTPYVVNLAGTGVKPGSIWLNRGQLVYAATYGGADPSAATFVITNKGAAPFGYSNTVSYDESASGWLSVAAATGQLAVAGLQTHTGTVSIAGLDVGVYYAVNTITSPTAENSGVEMTAMLTIAQATQAIVFAAIPDQPITNTVALSATATSSNLVSFSVASGPGAIAEDGTSLTFSADGTVYIVASQAGSLNYLAADSVTQRVNVLKMNAGITLSNLSYVYNGTVRNATVTTVPSGLAVQVTYNNSGQAPSNAGSYAVSATIQEHNYSGQATGTMTIAMSDQSITFANPGAQLTTNHLGLTVIASSGLSVTCAVVSGSAAISGYTNLTFTGTGLVSVLASQPGDGNWNAAPSVPQTFDVTKAVAGVTLNGLAQTYTGTPCVVTATTVPGGLTLNITYDGSASAPTAAGSYAVTGTVNEVMYQGSATGTLVVAPRSLAVVLIAPISKVYDGNATATLADTNYFFTGLAGSEKPVMTKLIGAYATTNAGAGIVVGTALIASDFTEADGFLKANYSLPTGATGSVGVITKTPLTATLVPAISKVYDGNATATLGATNYALSGFIGSETSAVNQTAGTYAITNAGTGISVSATLAAANFPGSVGGFNTNNYTLPTTAIGSVGVITKAPLTATLVPTISKVYDGNAAATLGATNYALSGLIGSETSAVNQTAGTYATTNAGTGISVSATLAAANFPGSVGGFNTNNYTLPTTASGSVGVITKAPLTAALVPTISKVYDGNATATLGATNYALSGLIGSETSAVNQAAGTYATTNAGTGISVSATLAAANFPGSVGGFNTNNYTLPTIASGSVGVITKAPLTATLVPTISKVYDGNATATLGATNYALSGLIGSETSAVNQTAGTYAITNAGTGISVSATLAAANFPGSVGGFNTNNYTLPTIASGSVGVITKAPLTATLVPTISKVYDGNATATLGATNYALSGLIGSETSAVNQTAGTYATTNAGTGISVSATLAAANFPGSVGGFNTNNYTLPTIVSGSVGVIKRALDSIIFSNTNHVYNGSEKPVTAIVGSGSAVALTYAGSASVPINVGIYAVTGVVNAANWEATNTTWLTIIKANQSITNFLPADGVQFVFGASTTVVATASSGLPVSFSNLTPAITLMVGNSLTFTNPGVASIQASQAGNSNWNVASSLTHIWRIGGLITNVTPRVANVGGGISVLIQGISLGNGSDITNVTLAGVQAGIVTQTVQSITVLAGAATGAVTGDVSVGSSSGGFMVMSNAFTYLWLDAPVQLDPVDITASNMLARWQTVSNATTHKLDVGLDTNFTAYLPGYHTNDVLMVNQYPVTGLSNSTWYAIRLFAWNSNGYSLPSRTVWVPTGTNTPYEEHVPLPGPVSTGAVTRFALTNMFYGTGLVYTVESSNTNVVSVSIIGGQLEVNPRNPGTATITVHAYNPSTGYTSSYSFLVTVSGPPALVGSSFMARERWNPRYTQVLRVCNNSATDAIGIRVLFTNLYPGITVENRTGTAWDGRPMIEMSTAFPVGSTQDLSIVYLCTGAYPANLYPPAIELQYILPGWNPPLPGAGAAVLTIVPLPGPGERIVLEFESVAGQSYAIEYMNNFSATGIWVQVPLRLRAGANRTQWIDAGPPATQPPAGLRAYQVKRLVE